MDGNRRWARERLLPRAAGHQAGVKSLKRLVRYVGERSLKYLTVYAFSSENWQRKEEEVSYLLKLFSDVLDDEFAELAENKVRLRFIGDLERMPAKLKNSMLESMENSRENTGLNLQVAINYGSRLELTQAARAIAMDVKRGLVDPESIDENMLSRYLYTADLPDPELLIRTGGEMRLSNYLLWQSAYTEFYVTSTLWPDFKPEDFDLAVSEFSHRNRRYGGD
ncbi:MAG: di-trans,poly-cis-decaprenylcistransferase [Candidatus Obscuribacterales bacterium]|nr:di-trans,poly-cis-decaprenylcistransferase [Candidatus Obscuribacterales bacterium]